MTYDKRGSVEETSRWDELQKLRALRRKKAQGRYDISANETLSNPVLPPWMTPSALETASPLGVVPAEFTGMDVRNVRKAPTREYPSEISGYGSSY